MSIRNNIKDIVTDIIGAGVWILTLVMIFYEKIVWVWEGIIGMIIGGVLFLIPDDLMTGYLKKFINKKLK